VTQTVRGEGDTFQERVIVQQVCAKFGAALVVNAVKFQVEMTQTLVDFQGLCNIARTLIVNVVI
jgi:hypothetical protein